MYRYPSRKINASGSVAALLVAILLAANATPGGAAGQDDDRTLADRAHFMVERFLAGDDDAYRDLLTRRMRESFPPKAAKAVRQDLRTRHGDLESVGEAWLEDRQGDYRRFRVPAVFARKTVDLRVVFDDLGRIAGFFQLPYVPSPAARAADPSLRQQPNPLVEGRWSGAIETPGTALEVIVELRFADDLWSGAIDIPAQAVKGQPLEDIDIGPAAATFTIAGIPGQPTFHGTVADSVLSGTFSQLGQTFPFRLARRTAAAPERPQEPRPPFPYRVEEVTVANHGITLAGTLTLPEGDGPFPAAVLITGSGGQDRNEEIFGHKPFLVLADHLTRAGIAVLRLDDRGVGQSTGSQTGATSETFAGDIQQAVYFLQGWREIDPHAVGLIGHSEGGLIAPMIAARSVAVAFIVLLAGPGVPGDEILLHQQELQLRLGGATDEQIAAVIPAYRRLIDRVKIGAGVRELERLSREVALTEFDTDTLDADQREIADTQAKQLASAWYRFFIGYDPRPVLAEVEVPVLALFGEKDVQVDPRQNAAPLREALARGGNPDVTVEVLPGLNHLFQTADTGNVSEYYTIQETMSPAVLDLITSWILDRFGRKP